MRVSGSTVLLTGATGGVGRVLARRLAELGARLVVTGRDTPALRTLATEVGARDVPADLADPRDVAALAERCAEVDILVANAALPATGALPEYSTEEIDRALAVNLRSAVVLSRLLVPKMVAARRGHLAFVGSMSGKAVVPFSSLYTASKFGMRGFAHALRVDLRQTGVGVSVIQPGLVGDVGMFADTGAAVPRGTRTVTADQVAGAVVRAIERDRCEVNVAPARLRLLCALAVQFPSVAAWVQRQGAPDGAVTDIVAAQRTRR
jgi:short-subunit dehydrogenase